VEQTKKLCNPQLTWETTFRASAEAFLENNPAFTDAVIKIIQRHTRLIPEISTSGGTSDARFMKNLCPVLEFGLLSCYAHHVDERAAEKDLYMLMAIYADILAEVVG
jgi:succinyl-diaminopimelate desuccinylase